MQKFLDVILPDEGKRVIAVMDPQSAGMRQEFLMDNTTAAGFAVTADRDPLQVFHGCHGYGPKDGGRKGANVVACRSFYLDLDVGPGKPYADKAAAVLALHGFTLELPVPHPLVVSSGNGVHVYWPMDADMTPGQWKITATLLKEAAARQGLKADPSRTADIASILRPPGSTHRKGDTPKEVKVLRWAEQMDHDDFRAALQAYLGVAPESADDVLGAAPAHVMELGRVDNSDLGKREPFLPSDANRVADRCAVMGMIRTTGGVTDQGTWYHGLQLLNRCEDGQELAHEWSKGDPRYTADEVDRVLARLEGVGPTSCDKFREFQPAICSVCPHKVKSPIVLGEAPPATDQPSQIRETPRPLPRKLLPVEPCQIDFAPRPLQDAILNIASGTPTPTDFVLASCLAAAGALLGNRVAVNFKRRGIWLERPNAWGMIVGDPSTKKSPASALARTELAGLEREKRAEYLAKLAVFQSEQLAYETSVSSLKAVAVASAKKTPGRVPSLPPMPPAPTEPTPTRYVTSDSSYEALGVLCRDNPTGMLVYQDELSGFLGEMAKPERQPAKGFMLGGWSGSEAYTFDRVGRGSIVLDRYSVSVFGGIQPPLLERLLIGGARNGHGADGLAQRFGMMVWPDPTPSLFVDERYDLEAYEEARAAFGALANLDPGAMGAHPPAHDGPPWLSLDDDAYSQFKSWYEDWHLPIVRDAGELDAYRQHVAKLPKVIATVAILIHALEDGGPSISGPTMARATAACRYFASHARRIYYAAGRSGFEPARALARRISLGEVAGTFTARESQRGGWTGMQTPEEAMRALELLEEQGWVFRSEKPPGATGGRPTTTWTVADTARGAAWE